MCCHDEDVAINCRTASFNASYQLFSMAFFCMVVPYLRLVLHASYLHVVIVLDCSFLVDYGCSLLFEYWACSKSFDRRPLGIQVFMSVATMIGSLMTLFTIHIWRDVDDGDLKIGIIVLAALFCSSALCAFGSFRSRLHQLPDDTIGGSSAGFLGFSLGAAIWTGVLWSPIDFSTGAHWLFGLASIIVFSLTCLILLVFGRTMLAVTWVPFYVIHALPSKTMK
jgi:hypothetical protein